jgi:4-amino-4-deoxy-L-arabinose transferase-like glycosyltransferase
VLAVPLLYHLVKRYFGTAAGLIAAFTLVVTPVAVATDRNNTMDTTLIFTLLLAAWAFIMAVDTGKLRWLLLGGVLVGIGFNIKMLQAFLPLPAFYALYFFGAKVGWRCKFGYLTLTTIVLLAVSLSWAIAVDLTPASQRPYIGSSKNNTVMELIVGHNGLDRLTGEGGLGGGGGFPGGGQMGPPANGQNGNFAPPGGQNGGSPLPAGQNGPFAPPSGQSGSFAPPTGQNGTVAPSGGTFQPGQGPGGGAGPGGPGFGGEIGGRSVFRLFTRPLANEIGWLLPFGLFSLAVVTVTSRLRLPVSIEHKGALLWGGWLLTELVFFSVAGFYHAYYLAMLAPPLAALVGMGVIKLWHMHERHKRLANVLLVLAGAVTVLFQVWVASQYVASPGWVIPGLALLVGGAVLLLTRMTTYRQTVVIGFACILCSMMLVPTVWSGLTTWAARPNVGLPGAYSGDSFQGPGGNFQSPGGNGPGFGGNSSPDTAYNSNSRDFQGSGGNFQGPGGGNDPSDIDENLVTYLEAHTQDTRYLVAVRSANQGDSYVLETKRPVLYVGGFLGTDPVIDAAGMQRLVDKGKLRYVLWDGFGGGRSDSSDIGTWLQSSCTLVTSASTRGGALYRCG